MEARVVAKVVLALGLAGCGGDRACPPPDGPLAAGTWAAQEGYFIVARPDGTAEVHQPCSVGTVQDARVTDGAVDWAWQVDVEDSGGGAAGAGPGDTLQGTVCAGRLTGSIGSRFGEFTFVKDAQASEIGCDG